MSKPSETAAALLEALHFAARKHRDQRRKGDGGAPYINHPIEVAVILARAGVDDPVTLQGAVLHDTLEDTDTTPEELEARFGAEVRRLVEEMSDDPALPKAEQKRMQVEHAPGLSARARQIKLGDKTSNVRDVTFHPPAGWSVERRREYLDWTERVIGRLRGPNPELEALYDRTLREGRETLAGAG